MEIKTVQFNAQHSLQYASAIAKPRLVGTQQERETGQYIASRLEACGFEVKPEAFQFSDLMSVFLLLEILLSQILIVITLYLNLQRLPLQYVTALLLLILFFLFNGINRWVKENSLAPAPGESSPNFTKHIQRLGRKFHTINYVAKLPDSPSEPAGIHLTLIAHYDSKSQRMPLPVRMALLTLGIGSILLFAIFTLLSALLPDLSGIALWIGGVGFLLGIPLLFLDLGNESPGALDNASSVGVLLHLAEVLAQRPDITRQIDLTMLFTSAEEISTIGALAYARRHKDQLLQEAKNGRSFVLNLDGVGVDGPLHWVGKQSQPACAASKSLVCLLRQACIDLDLELKRFNLPGALYDHIPFEDIGLDACTLVAINRKSLSVHTRRDRVEQLDVEGFQRAGQVVLGVIEILLNLPEQAETALDIGIEKFDIYKNDPVMRFIRDKMNLTPRLVFLAALGIGIADLTIAGGYNLLSSRDGIIGALRDPPYLLTMFVIIPLFLYTYAWMPDGLWCLFQSLPKNGLIKQEDLPTYRDNVRILVKRYSLTWFYLCLLIAFAAEAFVLAGNWSRQIHSFNAYFPLERLVLLRIPYGFLALYAATSVIVKWLLNSDWNILFDHIEPQAHPLHPDMAAGYGSFGDCIVKMMCIFVAIATFFFTLLLFDTYGSGTEVSFRPDAAKPLVIVSTVIYLVVGYIAFLYLPSRAARRALGMAKNRQLEIVAEQYNAEQKVMLEITNQGVNDPQAMQRIKRQIEKLNLLKESSSQIEEIPTSLISRRLIRVFGLSYLTIYLPIMFYNLLRGFMIPGTREGIVLLLRDCAMFDKVQGLISLLITGTLGNVTCP